MPNLVVTLGRKTQPTQWHIMAAHLSGCREGSSINATTILTTMDTKQLAEKARFKQRIRDYLTTTPVRVLDPIERIPARCDHAIAEHELDAFKSVNGGIDWCLPKFADVIGKFGLDDLFTKLRDACSNQIAPDYEFLLKGLSELDQDTLRANSTELALCRKKYDALSKAVNAYETVPPEVLQPWQESAGLLKAQLEKWSQWIEEVIFPSQPFGRDPFRFNVLISIFFVDGLPLSWHELNSFADFQSNRQRFDRKFQEVAEFVDQQYVKGNPLQDLKWSELQMALETLKAKDSQILALTKAATDARQALESAIADYEAKHKVLLEQLQGLSHAGQRALFRIVQAERKSQALRSRQSEASAG